MLTHFALPDPNDDGLWVVAYGIPATDRLSVIGAGYPERRARELAHRLNRLGEEANARSLAISLIRPEDRHIAPGLYTEENI